VALPGYWNVLITPYVKNTQVFICPSASSNDLRLWPHHCNLGYGASVAMASIAYPAMTLILNDTGLVTNPAAAPSPGSRAPLTPAVGLPLAEQRAVLH